MQQKQSPGKVVRSDCTRSEWGEGRRRRQTHRSSRPTTSLPLTTPYKLGERTDALISWPVIVDATAYDLTRGDLGLLRSTGGDFSAATDLCLVSKEPVTLHADGGVPAVGEGYWYLARGASCGGLGSYDSAGPGQIGSRDAEVDVAPNSCP